jgi:hypothetical protein
VHAIDHEELSGFLKTHGVYEDDRFTNWHCHVDDIFAFFSTPLGSSVESLRFLQPQVLPEFFEWSVRERFDFCQQRVLGLQGLAFILWGPSRYFEIWPACNKCDLKLMERAVNDAVASGIYPLSLAAQLRRTVSDGEWKLWDGSTDQKIFRAILHLSSNLHLTQGPFIPDRSWLRNKEVQGTPLLIYLVESSYQALGFLFIRRNPDNWTRLMNNSLRAWLRDLVAEDVDLVKYGKKERLLLHTRKDFRTKTFFLPFGDTGGADGRKMVTLDNIVFGPKPEHWKLVWDFHPERFLREFWNMMENPPLAMPAMPTMPGGWVEESKQIWNSDSGSD